MYAGIVSTLRYVYQHCLTIDVLVAMTILDLIESLSKKVTAHSPTEIFPFIFILKKRTAKYTTMLSCPNNVSMTCASFTGSFLDE